MKKSLIAALAALIMACCSLEAFLEDGYSYLPADIEGYVNKPTMSIPLGFDSNGDYQLVKFKYGDYVEVDFYIKENLNSKPYDLRPADPRCVLLYLDTVRPAHIFKGANRTDLMYEMTIRKDNQEYSMQFLTKVPTGEGRPTQSFILFDKKSKKPVDPASIGLNASMIQ